MRSTIVLLLLFFVLTSVNAQELHLDHDTLTLENAMTLALQYHPSLRAADANVRAAEAGLTQSTSAYFPTITSSASWTRTEGAFVFNPDFPPRDQKYNNYSAGIQAQQLIFDFGKTFNRVSANSSLVDAAGADAQSVRENVIVNVQLSYFTYIQALQVVHVNEEAQSRAEQHLKQAKAFYTVGKRAQLDVTKAEVDLANANVNLIRAKNQHRLAKLQLENAMGIHPQKEYYVREEFDISLLPLSLDSAMSAALTNRPEFIAAKARVEASRSLQTAAWDQHLPTLSASGNYTWTNFDFPLFSRWTAGVTLSIPIFQGFATEAQAQQAKATADAAQANLDLLAESVRLEVEQYYLSLKEAEERIGATTKLVDQATESMTLAEKQYAAGVGSVIDVTDAQLALSNARITRIQALFDYNSSLIRLKRAIGMIQ